MWDFKGDYKAIMKLLLSFINRTYVSLIFTSVLENNIHPLTTKGNFKQLFEQIH